MSKQPEQLLAQELATLRQTGTLTPALVLKDPYVLDFLGLQDRYLEKDLEDAILRELENFLLELGAGFMGQNSRYRICWRWQSAGVGATGNIVSCRYASW